jgi:Protein kinase domain.
MSNPFEGKPHNSVKPEANQIEKRIDELLSLLPEEIGSKWEEKHLNDDPEKQLSSLEEILARRSKIRIPHTEVETHERPRTVRVEETYPLAITQLIERLEHEAHTLLGQGKAGRVVASVRNPEICYKVMLPIDRIPRGTNSVAVEADIQMAVSALGEIEQARAPQVHAYVEHGETRAIMMESLDAVSIRDLANGKEGWPESFEPKRFFASLEAFVAVMHDNGYHHRDLHDGNVMVDRSTGNPRIIDFGYSRRIYGDDEPYRNEYIHSGQKQELVLMSDLGQIHGLKSLVRQKHAANGGS